MDPLTTLLTALTLGAKMPKGTLVGVETAIGERYAILKQLIKQRYKGVHLEGLEKAPDSNSHKTRLRHELKDTLAFKDEEVLEHASILIILCERAQHDRLHKLGGDTPPEGGISMLRRSPPPVFRAGPDIIKDVFGRPERDPSLEVSATEESKRVPTERRIGIWITERTEDRERPLQVGETYTLNFKVGEPVNASLVEGDQTKVPSSEIPPQGLQTDWVVTSRGIELLPGSPGTAVDCAIMPEGLTWTARFSLLIPHLGESQVPQVKIAPRAAQEMLHVIIYAGREVYRQLSIHLVVAGNSTRPTNEVELARITEDLVHAPMAHMCLRTTHEWTTPPGELAITVIGSMAVVRGDAGPQFVDAIVPWDGVQASVAGKIDNVRSTAERFRAKWEKYLNDIDPLDLSQKLGCWQPEYHWEALNNYTDPAHEQTWSIVQSSQELRDLAYDGSRLFQAFFPGGSDLRRWFDALPPGQRLDISWTRRAGQGLIPHVPWGLIYCLDLPPFGQPIDPMGFMGLRFRIGYTAHAVDSGSKTLGALADTHRAHFLYWGNDPNDPTGKEARWQQAQWSKWQNQVFVPTRPQDPNAKAELLQLLEDPKPAPTSVIYLFCQCAVGDGNDPVLRFAGTAQTSDNVRRSEFATKLLPCRPFVFANACTTAATDPYIANELEEVFFDRGCRAYLGTETKVPIDFASRFASIFFHFFYRILDPEPMAVGEAVAQTRLFLWTRFRNIGGLFYAHVNQYELFMAQGREVLALRA